MLSLLERWNQLAVHLPTGTASESLRQELFTRYSEPHRAYHNLNHLEFCFRELDTVRAHMAISREIELALWFHDVIYDPRAKDNEEQSARYFQEKLGSFLWGEGFKDRIKELILTTKTHQSGEDPEGQILCDIDLAILGQDEELFAAYEKQIRSEYSWVEEAAYRKGRSEVLTRFLKYPRIFATPFFHDRYEYQARINLQQSIDSFSL